MDLTRLKHVVVEGPAGNAKQAVCQYLAQQLGAALMLDAPERNPWESRRLLDGPRWALPAQLETLRQHEQLLTATGERLNQGDAVINDFLIERDRLLALLTLPEEEHSLYQWVFAGFRAAEPIPDLVIGLMPPSASSAQTERQRQEAPAWQTLFHHYDASPILLLQADTWMPGERQDDLVTLSLRLTQMRGRREVVSMRD